MSKRSGRSESRKTFGRIAGPIRGFHEILTNFATPPLLFLSLVAFIQPARSQSIWFSPRSGLERVPDFMELFHEKAPWEEAASHVAVFEISQWMSAAAPEAELRQIFDDLRRRQIDLSVGLLPLSPGPDGCGIGVEGYSAPGQSLSDATRLQKLGADIAYFVLDEPLFYGHEFKGNPKQRACQSSIPDIAKEVAVRISQVRTVYPNVPIGDVEPFPVSKDWNGKLEQWFDAFQAAIGERLAFFRLDMQWKGPWREQLPELVEILHRRGIPLQVIYNGTGNAASDEEWIQGALAHAKEFEEGAGVTPEGVAIQCWTPRPSRLLPESDPKTLTSLINQYANTKRGNTR